MACDPRTQGHGQRLAAYATALGRALTLDDDDLAALERGGFLHDIGKIGVPDAVLRSHHERLDGSGNPDGLRNTHVRLLAQIVGTSTSSTR